MEQRFGVGSVVDDILEKVGFVMERCLRSRAVSQSFGIRAEGERTCSRGHWLTRSQWHTKLAPCQWCLAKSLSLQWHPTSRTWPWPRCDPLDRVVFQGNSQIFWWFRWGLLQSRKPPLHWRLCCLCKLQGVCWLLNGYWTSLADLLREGSEQHETIV